MRFDLAEADGAQAERPHPEQEHEGEAHLHEHRHQNSLDRHDALPLAFTGRGPMGPASRPYTPPPCRARLDCRDGPLIMEGSSIDEGPKPPLNLAPKGQVLSFPK